VTPPHGDAKLPRQAPPMFASAIGPGDHCEGCQRAGRDTVKVILPGGIQVCGTCDS
jgi:hypothetical protein